MDGHNKKSNILLQFSGKRDPELRSRIWGPGGGNFGATPTLKRGVRPQVDQSCLQLDLQGFLHHLHHSQGEIA